ncbi:YkgJ family cysteine cluster protein [Thermodesulfobacteriota bacterium]
MTIRHRSYFFDQGLFFECLRCGACCTGDPGTVRVHHSEIERIARFLAMRGSSFVEKYLEPFRENFSIREDQDGRCYFYQDGCTIYPVRPSQCQTFPFWFENLRSSKKWNQISRECPGIGRGRFFPKEQILEIVHSTFVDYVESIVDTV